MPAYISLLNFTDQGIRNVKETTKRARAFQEMAGKAGVGERPDRDPQGVFSQGDEPDP